MGPVAIVGVEVGEVGVDLVAAVEAEVGVEVGVEVVEEDEVEADRVGDNNKGRMMIEETG